MKGKLFDIVALGKVVKDNLFGVDDASSKVVKDNFFDVVDRVLSRIQLVFHL